MESSELIIQVSMICAATGTAGLVGGLCGFLYDIDTGKKQFTLVGIITSVIIGASIGVFTGSALNEYNIFWLISGCYFIGLNSYRLIEVMRDKVSLLLEEIIRKFTR